MTPTTIDDAWTPADPLGEALHALRMSGTFYCRSSLAAPWGIELPAMEGCLMFHLVAKGRCWMQVPDHENVMLEPGDLGLVPHGNGHLLKDAPTSPAVNIFDLPREQITARYELLEIDGGGAAAQIICGAVCVEDPSAQRVADLLPPVIKMGAAAVRREGLLNLVEMVLAEAESMRPGGDTIITRVSDILVVQAIRHWLENDPEAKEGWLGALRDEQIGRALAYLHRWPSHPWTVESLGEKIGLSRSVFAARFQELVGDTPMHYLRKRRFEQATRWLEESDLSIIEIADRLGYQSEAAFNRAYKKGVGQTPGAVRRGVSKGAAA